MSHDVAFIPRSHTARPGQDFVYREQSSGGRGLYVLMQDASTRGSGARRQFLLTCFRDTVSRYLAMDRLIGAPSFLRERVIAFDAMARGVETRVDNFEALGIFVVVRDPDCLYVLCARGASARVRWRGVFVPIATPEVGGVTELSIETARAQHDLFAQGLPETLALYRVIPEAGSDAPRQILLGGTAQDMAAAVDLVDQPRSRGIRDVPADHVSHTVLMVSTETSTLSASRTAASAPHRGGSRLPRARTVTAAALGLAVLVAGAAGIRTWRDHAAVSVTPAGEEQTALRESPAPPPPQKRVVEAPVTEAPRDEKEARRGFDLAWEQSFQAAVTSSPSVAGDAVVFGSRDGRVYSFGRERGERQWAYTAQGGVGASPVFHSGSVIAADYGGNVVRLKAGDGKLMWKRKLGEKIVSTPAVTNERVVVGTLTGRVYALSLETGRVLWKFSARGAVRGAIAHVRETFLVPSNDGRLYAVAEDTGARRWSLPLGGPVLSSPDTDGDIVVIGSERGDVVGVDLAKGTQRWKYHAGGAVNSAIALVDGRVFAGAADRRLYCIDAKKGELVWRFDTGGAILSRPFVADGRVMVTSYDGFVYCLNADNGELIDRFETRESIFSSPVVVDGRVFFGNNAGRFYCLDLPQS